MVRKKNISQFIDNFSIHQFKNGEIRTVSDPVIKEETLTIAVNDQEKIEIVCTFSHPKELVAGYLLNKGIIFSAHDIKGLSWSNDQKKCALQLSEEAFRRLNTQRHDNIHFNKNTFPDDYPNLPITDNFTIRPEQVLSLMNAHLKSSELFQRTGAVHSCSLCDKKNTIGFYEDIGRMNVVDKLSGDLLLRGIDVSGKLVLLSCRISQEIMRKVIHTGIKVVISHGAPTNLALKMADAAGITVIGFARDSRFNIYTNNCLIL